MSMESRATRVLAGSLSALFFHHTPQAIESVA